MSLLSDLEAVQSDVEEAVLGAWPDCVLIQPLEGKRHEVPWASVELKGFKATHSTPTSDSLVVRLVVRGEFGIEGDDGLAVAVARGATVRDALSLLLNPGGVGVNPLVKTVELGNGRERSDDVVSVVVEFECEIAGSR